MTCPHADAQIVEDLQPLFVGELNDSPIAVDIYFCNDCNTDFACKSDTFQIISPLSLRDYLADETASEAGNEAQDGYFQDRPSVLHHGVSHAERATLREEHDYRNSWRVGSRGAEGTDC